MKLIYRREPNLIHAIDLLKQTPLTAILHYVRENELNDEARQLIRDKIDFLVENGADACEGLIPAIHFETSHFLDYLIAKGADCAKVPELLHHFASLACLTRVLEKAPQLATQPDAETGKSPLEAFISRIFHYTNYDPALLCPKIRLFLQHGAAAPAHALGIVSYLGDHESLKELLERDVDLNPVYQLSTNIGGSALELAIQSPFTNSVECLRAILQKEPGLVRQRNPLPFITKQINWVVNEEKRALLSAKLDLLIDAGVDIHESLGIAATLGHPAAVQKLLQMNADPTKPCKIQLFEETAVYCAIGSYYEGSVGCLRILLEHSSKLANFNPRSSTPLSNAIQRREYADGEKELAKTRIQKVRLLIAANADVNAKDHEYGATSLQTALDPRNADIEIIEAVSKAGAFWNVTVHGRVAPDDMVKTPAFQKWLDASHNRDRFNELLKQVKKL